MNLKKAITTIALAGTIALTGAQGAFAGSQTSNTSETGHSAQVTRETRSQGQQTLRGEGEWAWMNYETYDLLMVTRIDFGSEGAAEYGVDMAVNGGLLEESGFDVDGTFRIRDIDGCEGVNISLDGMRSYMVVCADGDHVNMIFATDKDVALDTASDMQDGYEPTAPRGYVEEDV